VGTLLDIGHLASSTQVAALRDVAIPFIRGLYPIPDLFSTTSPFGLVPPLSAVQDFLADIAQVLGIPLDALLPFGLVLELNGVAILTGYDRLMGVLPLEWFHRFSYDLWAPVTGLSLGTAAPRAVIVVPAGGNDYPSAPSAPAMPLPAHEMGHTFGL